MITYTVSIDKTEYDQFVEQHPYGNLLQGSKWSQVKDNWQSQYLAFYQDQDLVAGACVLIRTIAANFRVAYIPRGPVVDYSNQDLVQEVFSVLQQYAKKERFLLLKCDPSLLFDRTNPKQVATCEQVIASIEKTGAIWSGLTFDLSDTVQPRFQANKHLTPESIEDYQKHVKRLIKTARKKGVDISQGHANEVQVFADLIALTEQRKQIHLRNYDYFNKIKTIYGDKAEFYFAKIDIAKQLKQQKDRLQQLTDDLAATPDHQKNRIKNLNQQITATQKQAAELAELAQHYPNELVIAGVLGIRFATGIELLYAGMNNQFKHYYPQYLLNTEIFKTCYQNGLTWANMGGVEGKLDGGLSTFKLSFKPTIDEYIGEFNLPSNKWLYKFGKKAYSFYKKQKSLRRQKNA
ncbi:MAG: peptidoglycan bridge formation protein FemAB [Streptococcus pyogenes]|nr:MAG: peptidoglycan bridge formation protein FemAB [Streptococcus pyogenes]